MVPTVPFQKLLCWHTHSTQTYSAGNRGSSVAGSETKVLDPANYILKPMLWIRDILVQIRIRIRRCVPLIYGLGYGSGSCFFRRWWTRCQQKIIFFHSLLLITFKKYITSVFKDKKLKRSHKIAEIKVFLTFLRIREAQKLKTILAVGKLHSLSFKGTDQANFFIWRLFALVFTVYIP
jgi:hypothetical protein